MGQRPPGSRRKLLGALLDAHVQFVVVGELASVEGAGSAPLRLVVSGHPTNLASLGRVLDSFGSSLRARAGTASGFARIADPDGTLSVHAGGVHVDLVFGGTRTPLFAETRAQASEVEIYGLQMLWSRDPAPRSPQAAPTGKALSRRLVSAAEHLARVVERSGNEGSSALGGRGGDDA